MRNSLRVVAESVLGLGVLTAGLAAAFVRSEPARRREARERAHEEHDASPRAVTAVGLLFVAAMALILVLVSWLFVVLTGHHVRVGPPAAGIQNPPPRVATAPPRLDANAPATLAAVRAAQEQLLGTYGWVDRDAGVVRIPIDRAIDVLVRRGLPSRPPTAPEPEPVASASGRFVDGARQ